MWGPKFAFDPEECTDGDEETTASILTPRGMLRGALWTAAAALFLFALFPRIDLALEQYFYIGHGRFLGNEIALFRLIRRTFSIFFYLTCTTAIVGLIISMRTGRPWLDLDVRKWLFIGLCLLAGPLVVANIGLKDHWGRARPRDIIEFAGKKEFTPPFPPASQCDYNCSFVSGEASSIFMVLFAAALLFKSRSRSLAALGIVLGGLAGLTRMAQGGHFLSDVIFAGVLMAATAAIIQMLFETVGGERSRLVEQRSGRA
ncbi:MAG: phosphatase PAP2 family protein [Proteobacteria bacterium]|nr:phosphatase PAP2 family protein [Pseudomonadota bacterium]